QQIVLTSLIAPAQLSVLPARLLSRLISGLVVRLEPLAAPSRLALLEDQVQRRQLAIRPEALRWLAVHLLGGGRQLAGALDQIEVLARQQAQPLDQPTVAAHFQELLQAGQPTVDRIAQQVGNYFQVDARYLKSRRR